MLLECSCGKMYRVRDDAANPPTKCPACGRPLKQHSGGAPAAPAGPDPKVKDLEGRVQGLEREASSAKAAAELKDKELREAQASIARLGSDLEKDRAAYKEALRKKEQEIEEKQKRIGDLEGEGTKFRQQSQSQSMALLKQKDAALQEARDRVSQLEEELAAAAGKGGVPAEVEARLKDLEAEVETARRSRAALTEELTKEKDAFRESLSQKVQELEASEARAAALEKTGGGGWDPKTPVEERARMRIQQLEKIVQDGERRYREVLAQSESQGGGAAAGGAALAAKDAELAQALASLQGEKESSRNLEKRLAELEKARKTAPAPERRDTEARARMGEARYLAGDLDKSLGSISASLQTLVERVKRLHGSLEATEAPAEPAPPSFAPATAGASEGRPSASEGPAREGPYAPAEPAPEPALEAPAELVQEAGEEPEAEEEKAEVAHLETFPDPEPAVPGGLPADETLLDMGGLKRRDPQEEPAPAEPPLEDVPLSAETSPGPLPEEEAAEAEPPAGTEPPKKKGFFGKLFGKK